MRWKSGAYALELNPVRIDGTDSVLRILSLIHESDVPSGSFSTTARELAHTVDEHSFSLGSPPSPADTYDAVMIFGGTDNVDERAAKPWMDHELEELGSLIAGRTPVLGICLGGQLIAEAAGGSVFPLGHEGVGWQEVELTPEAPKDPLVGALPGRFRAYLWHEYQFSLPSKAVPLARSDDCLQAFRLGDRVWALQFHPEVTAEIADTWIEEYGEEAGIDRRRSHREVVRNVASWNQLGHVLCCRFLAIAASHSRSDD
jgi:GMP synthase-like glutamine amidotransferase